MAKIKSNSVTQFELLHDGNILFRAVGAGERVFDRSKTSLEVRHMAELQGWVKRIINMAAVERDTETGLSATPEVKFKRMVAAMEWYEAGGTEWRIGGNAIPKADDAGLVFQAVMRHFKDEDAAVTEARVAKLVAKGHGKDRAEVLKALAKVPAVVAIVGQIKAERAAANKAANAADLLAEMGDDEDAEQAE